MTIQVQDVNISLNMIHGEGILSIVICKSVTGNIINTAVTAVAYPIIRIMHFVKKIRRVFTENGVT